MGKKEDLLKTQTCILKVNIDCDGCKRKVRKILQKIDGVYSVAIDMQQGKVTVTGDVEPDVLIKKLEKSGKRAELCSTGKGEKKSKDGELDNVNEQLKKLLQMGGGKGGGNNEMAKAKDGKDQPKGGVIGGGGGDGKNGQQVNFQQLLEQMRSGSKDFTMKDQKPVKVDFPSEGSGDDDDDFSGDEFDEDDDGEFDDEDYEFDEDDEFDDDEFDEDEEDFDDDEEFDHHHPKQQKGEKGGGGEEKAKKGGGGGGIMSLMGKVIGGKNEGKNGNEGKKGGSPKHEGEGKNGNEGKKGGGPKNEGEGKNGNKNGGGGGGGGKKGGGGGGGMGPVGQYQVGPMGQQIVAAPMMNMNGGGGGGYYQGMGPMGPMPGNPYQQQQYMAMMNQQRMMQGGGGAYHPAMYGRPPPGYGYVPPPVYQDHITHMFSDENPGSCSIM